jgi:aspartate carbamoyltransferase catalytic subunit
VLTCRKFALSTKPHKEYQVLKKSPMRHVVQVQDFRNGDLTRLFELADEAKRGLLKNALKDANPIVCSLFYEPSTRTRMSFEAAALGLGCYVIGTENAAQFSSAIKGESLEDSVRVISGYCNAIVLRHFQDNMAERASLVSRVPIINAGCGMGQHPTQAFLDLYTILSKLKSIEGRTFALCGDLKHGRTIRSLAYLLGRYKIKGIQFVAPQGLEVEPDIKDYLTRRGVLYQELSSLDSIIESVDVVYATRVQKERIVESVYRHVQYPYEIGRDLVLRMKPDALLMHPLPRNNEIAENVDELPQAIYFTQAENGLYVRMALLYMLLRT